MANELNGGWESLKNCSKGSPRMAGKSAHGKTNKQTKKETRPIIRASGGEDGVVLGLWRPSSLSHQLLPTDIFRIITQRGGNPSSHHISDSFSFFCGH